MIKDMQAALGVAVDGEAGPQTAEALRMALVRSGFKGDVWPRGDSVLVDISAYAPPEATTAPSGGDWMQIAASVLGQHERRNADALDAFLASDGEWDHNAAEIPWCGEFVDTCLNLAGHKAGLENPLGARNWLKFGRSAEPKFGAIMVFWRGRIKGWQGHVGFYVGGDASHYHILGGNQGNRVSVARIAKDRFLGARWPVGASDPARFSIKPGMTTVNEA